jgi:hypothetical protein
MNSDDMLNQPPQAPTEAPLVDDPIQPRESLDALRAFLDQGGAPPASAPPPPEPSAPLSQLSSMAPADPTKVPDDAALPMSAEAPDLVAEIARAEEELRTLEMTPAERYRKRLELRKISLLEAQKILDHLIVQLKPYMERYHLAGPMYVTFRTRTQADQDRLNEVLEDMAPRFRSTVLSEEARQHIASSIVTYGPHQFARNSTDDIEKIITWVTDIPQPVFVLLQRKLYEFDTKIDAVFQDGYLENFWATPS